MLATFKAEPTAGFGHLIQLFGPVNLKDGTKGFLRGGQFAVCLALVVDGTVELGVIGFEIAYLGVPIYLLKVQARIAVFYS